MPKIRVGIPPDVPSLPLAWGLLKGHHGDLLDPVRKPASVLAQLVQGERLDVALLSSLDILGLKDVEILPDLCLSARGSAELAFLIHRSPLEALRVVAATPGAETAVSQLAVIMQLRGLEPPTVKPSQPRLESMLEESGAALIFGPLPAGLPNGYEVLDLVAEWEAVSGLPWVAAAWAVRRAVQAPDLSFYLKSSLRYGLSMLDTLIRESAAANEVDPEDLENRFQNNYSYFLRSEERSSLDKLAEQMGRRSRPGSVHPFEFRA